MTEPPTDPILRDQYEAWRLLGAGALGETWQARDKVTGHEVVVKLRPHTEVAERMAMREAQVLKGLASDHLQRLSTVIARARDGMALVYDYIEGPSLSEVLNDAGPMTPEDAVEMAVAILSGLAVLHRVKAIHRDVSPDNVILRGGDPRRAVLIDYNALGALTEYTAMGQTTVAGEFAGKGFYMAPEQVAGAPQSAATDIWGLGAVLYEALTGRRLRQAGDFAELVRASLEPPDLGAAPAVFRGALDRLLAVDPAARPNAAEAARLIRMAVDPLDAHQQVFRERTDGSASHLIRRNRAPRVAIDYPPAPAAARGANARGGWLLTLGIVVVALIALMLWLLSDGLLGVGGIASVLSRPDVLTGLLLLAGGAAVAMGGSSLAAHLRRRAARVEEALPFRAIDLIGAPDAQERLSRTIVMGIDAYRKAAGAQAQDLLTVTMVALAHEYANADSSDARIAALKMLNELHAKVALRLRPWWLDYEKLVARGVALTTLVAGAVAAIEGVRRLLGEAGI